LNPCLVFFYICFSKGDLIIAEGAWTVGSYINDQNEKRQTNELTVSGFNFVPANKGKNDKSDDDEEEVQNELSSSQNASRSVDFASPQRQSQKKNVIDLTLDSDEDEPAPVQSGKRKLSEAGLGPTSPTEPIWKKSRHDIDYQLPSITTLQNFRQPALTNGGRLPPPPAINPGTPSHYPHYPGASAPPALANNLPIRGNGSAQGSLQLPHLPGLSPPRPNGHPRWP